MSCVDESPTVHNIFTTAELCLIDAPHAMASDTSDATQSPSTVPGVTPPDHEHTLANT